MCQRERSLPMKRMAALSLVCLMVSLFAVEPSRAVENVRVAYPSMGTSVFCLIIAQKEGYLKEEGLDAQLLSIRGEIAIRTTLARSEERRVGKEARSRWAADEVE